MTPVQKVRALILQAAMDQCVIDDDEISEATVDGMFERLQASNTHWDAMNEVRQGNIKTGLPMNANYDSLLAVQIGRHYETREVAAQLDDGSWVGWTYVFGGGKHGNAEEVPWVDFAYDVECTETEKLVLVQTFARKAVSA